MRRNFPRTKVIPEYVKFAGGLDLETPALSIAPGRLIACQNYVADVNGGYERIDGYERYDGYQSKVGESTAPSDAYYYYVPVTFTGTVLVGDDVVGDSSGAVGFIIQVDDDALYAVMTSGEYIDGEDLIVMFVTVGSVSAPPVRNGAPNGYDHANSLNTAADLYRTSITGPDPGNTNPICGVAILDGTTYCWQDNTAGTACTMYEATAASGWAAVELYKEISFDTGVGDISDDTAITQLTSAATATCKRTVLESGSFSGGDAAGRLILDNITGTFDDTHAIQVGGVTKVTATSTAEQITLSPDGRYETLNHNFYGATGTMRMYGCNGVDRGFEFDGDVLVPINTGMTNDTPEHVIAHKKQLFFSFGSSSQNSGIGRPYEWTAVTGAAEIAIGDDITGYAQMAGDALAIISKNRIDQLIGTDVDDFTLSTVSNDTGAIEHTIQKLDHVFCLDNKGVIVVTPTDAYGNFSQVTMSRVVQALIEAVRVKAVASVVYKKYNQYRIYCNDGTGLCVTLLNQGLAFSSFVYPDNVTCAVSGEDSSGNEVIFFGSDDGIVYQADKGSSFDGDEIEAFFVTPFNHSKGPTTLKSYKKATIEMTAEGYSAIRLHPDFSYGDPDSATHFLKTVTLQGGGGMWDVHAWGAFFYDSPAVEVPTMTIDGHGSNLSLVVYSKSDIDLGHKIDGAVVHYIRRKIQP